MTVLILPSPDLRNKLESYHKRGRAAHDNIFPRKIVEQFGISLHDSMPGRFEGNAHDDEVKGSVATDTAVLFGLQFCYMAADRSYMLFYGLLTLSVLFTATKAFIGGQGNL